MASFEDMVRCRKEEVMRQQDMLERLERVGKRFNLATEHVMGIGESLFSSDVNKIASEVYYEYIDNEGRSPWCASPYALVEGLKIFTDPISFTLLDVEFELGEKDDQPSVNWIKGMLDAGISEELIQKVKDHLDGASDFNLGKLGERLRDTDDDWKHGPDSPE